MRTVAWSVFGRPISGFVFHENGLILQHFERARFEWHPELPPGQDIVLAALGGNYFYQIGEDPNRINKVAPISDLNLSPAETVLSLRTLVFVEKAITLPSDTQKVYVVVQDQSFIPMGGATGILTIDLPGSNDLIYQLTTDTNGFFILHEITLNNLPPNSLIPVTVTISYAGLKDSATTSFRTWR